MRNKGIILGGISIIGSLLLSSTQVLADTNLNHYIKSEWSTGYCYKFEITNNNDENLDWTLDFDLDSDLKSNWSGVFEETDTWYSVTWVSYNKLIKPGKTKNFGYCAYTKVLPSNIELIDNNNTEVVVFENTFTENWITDWVLQTTRKWGFENFELLEWDILRATYPAWSYKPSGEIRGWGGFIKRLDTTGTDMYLSYDVKLEDWFDFVKWGKLPGLCGWECPTWGWLRGEGFSTRFMWRAEWAMEIYAYLQDKEEWYGTSIWRSAGYIGVWDWFTLTQRVKLNTPGNSDGIVEFYINERKVYSESNLNIVDTKPVVIDGILFSTFFWGSDESWATPIESHSQFRNFKVWTQ